LIKELVYSDLDQVVSVHLNAFPKSALTRLGSASVMRYYRWQLEGPHECLAVGWFEDDRLLGFLFGGKFRAATSGFLHKNRSFLAFTIITRPWLIANPLILDRISVSLRALRKKYRKDKALPKTQEKSIVKSFTILSVAVNSSAQGTGIGLKMMDFAQDYAISHEYTQLHLTVHPDNLQAVKFYAKFGFDKVEQDGQWRGAMLKNL